MRKKSVLSKFIGGGIKKATALGLTAFTVGTSFIGMSDTAFAANSDFVSIKDRYGNTVDVDNGFEFKVYTDHSISLKSVTPVNSETKTQEIALSYTYDANKENIIISFLRPSDGAKYTNDVKLECSSYGHLSLDRKVRVTIPEFGTSDILIGSHGGFDYKTNLFMKFDDGTTVDLSEMKPNGISYQNVSIPFKKSNNEIRFVSDDGEDLTININDIGGNTYIGNKSYTVKGKLHEYEISRSDYGSPTFFDTNIAILKIDGIPVNGLPQGMSFKNPKDVNIDHYKLEDNDNLPDSKVKFMCTKVPEKPNSVNLYNFIYGTLIKDVSLSNGNKYEFDLSKINDIIPIEKREYYSNHIEDVNNAHKVLFGSTYYGDSGDNLDFSDPYLAMGSVDEMLNYELEPQMTNLVFNKTVDGYTATEDFEFLLAVPTYVADTKTRFNVAAPTGSWLYNERLESYKLRDNPGIVDMEYLGNYLKYYLQLTVPAHFGEDKEYKMIESTLSQLEKTNIAEVFGPALIYSEKFNVDEFVDSFADENFINSYVDNIKKNSGGVLDADAEHLRQSLLKFNWMNLFKFDGGSGYWDKSFEELKVFVDDYMVKLQDAGYTHNDFALMHMASAGMFLGLDKDYEMSDGIALKDESLEFYKQLVSDLGIADKVEYTELGLPKIVLKKGETIKFNDLKDGDFGGKDLPILIYEKAYDDTEKVINRTFRLCFDKDGTVNIYAGGTSESEVVENNNNVDKNSETVTDKPTEAAGTEVKEDSIKENNIKEANKPVSNKEVSVDIKKIENTDSPKTGDNINYTWVILGAISGISLVSAILFKKFKKEV